MDNTNTYKHTTYKTRTLYEIFMRSEMLNSTRKERKRKGVFTLLGVFGVKPFANYAQRPIIYQAESEKEREKEKEKKRKTNNKTY